MNLGKIFYPKCVAVVGASTKAGTAGNDIVKNLATEGYKGEVFPINPHAKELWGLRCYRTMTAVGKDIDLMVIVVPAASVVAVLREGASLRVPAACIISSGFKEAGNQALEDEVRNVCLENNIALIGPNCLGVINSEVKMNASFAPMMPACGNVAFVSQSGALCAAVLDYAEKLNIGFSKFMSIGNKAVIDELAILDYLAEDDRTQIIAFYAEQLVNSEALIPEIRKIASGPRPKPCIFLKSGRTSAGAKASASHTGALAGNDSAYEALFAQVGAIRASSISELFDYIQIFAYNEVAPAQRVAIVTNAGGPGVLSTDEVISNKLNMAVLSEDTKTTLKAALPAAASVDNPVDVLGDAKADRYAIALDLVAKDENVDTMCVILTPQSMTDITGTAEAIVKVKKNCHKPIVVSFMGEATVAPGVQILHVGGVAHYAYPEQAARSLAVMQKMHVQSHMGNGTAFNFTDVNKAKVAKIFAEAKKTGKTSFPEAEALEILAHYNFPLLKSAMATSAEDAQAKALKIGSRLVMKIVSPDILHKSDVGGVMLNLEPGDVAAKYDEMMKIVSLKKPTAKLTGVLLVEMANCDKGTELILGSTKDPSLGNMVMVGLGGIYVEILKDVVFGLAPLNREDVVRMINSLKAKKIFEGARGQAALDVDALIETIGRLSLLLADFPEIKEMDINPLLLLPVGKSAKVLDARIVIG